MLSGAGAGTVTSPTSGDIVTCTGTGNTVAIIAQPGSTNVTVAFGASGVAGQPTFEITNPVHPSAAEIIDDSFITLNAGARVEVNQDFRSGLFTAGDDNVMTLNDGSALVVNGQNTHAFEVAYGSRNTIVLNAGSQARTEGLGARGLRAYGSNDSTITLNGGSTLTTVGNNAEGAYFFADRGTLTLNGASRIETAGDNSPGANFIGDDGTVTLNGGSSVSTQGSNAAGASLVGNRSTATFNTGTSLSTSGNSSPVVSMVGDNASVTLNGGSLSSTGTQSVGIYVSGANASIALNDATRIQTSQTNSHGMDVIGTGSVSIGSASVVTATGAGSDALQIRGTNAVSVQQVVNRGTLTGSSNGIDAGTGRQVVVNTGAISGGTSSVSLGADNDALTLSTGSSLGGSAFGGGGTDSLTLLGSGSENDRFIGFETLTMRGTVWTLSGVSAFDTIDIQLGELNVNGNVTAPVIGVAAGSLLTGSGVLNGVITSAGTVKPGNSVGTLNINGAFVNNGATLEIEITQAGADLLQIVGNPGTATINGGILELVPSAVFDFAGDVVTATGGITGGFDEVTGPEGFAFAVDQFPNSIRVAIAGPGSFAGHFEAAPQSSFVFMRAINNGFGTIGTNTAQARPPDPNASAAENVQLAFAGSGLLPRTLAPNDPGLGDFSIDQDGAWGRVFGQFSDRPALDGGTGSDFGVHGVAFGYDVTLDGSSRYRTGTVGVAGGFSHTSLELDAGAGGSETDNYHAAVYGSLSRGLFFAEAIVSGAINDYETARSTITSAGPTFARGSFAGYHVATHAALGVEKTFGDGSWGGPVLSLDYVHLHMNDYVETEADVGNLQVNAFDDDVVRITADMRLGRRFSATGLSANGEMVLFGRAGITGEFVPGDRGVQVEFVSLGGPTTLFGDGGDRFFGVLSLGGAFDAGDGVSLFARYDGEYARGYTNQGATIGAHLQWH